MLINYFFFLGGVATTILRSDDNTDFSAMFSRSYFGKLEGPVLLREKNLLNVYSIASNIWIVSQSTTIREKANAC